jgi:DNA-binding IclR family transcriptional regulator
VTTAQADPPTPSTGAAEAAPGAISAVDRAVDVLLLFGRSLQPTLGVTEIADELGMPKSGVHRVLNTLRRRRLVTYDPATRKYALGQAAVALSQGYAARHDMQAMATQEVSALRRATGETASLAIRRHASVLVRAQSVPDHELRVEFHLGRPLPLHVGASGKTFLAFVPEHEVDEYVTRSTDTQGRLERFTPHTLDRVDDLRADLAEIRERGYAISHGERLTGVVSIAAPVLDHEEYPVSVLAVTGPESRLDVSAAYVVTALQESAARLSAEMGYTVD